MNAAALLWAQVLPITQKFSRNYICSKHLVNFIGEIIFIFYKTITPDGELRLKCHLQIQPDFTSDSPVDMNGDVQGCHIFIFFIIILNYFLVIYKANQGVSVYH